MAGLQQLTAVALGTGALACLPVIANSGDEEVPTNSSQTAESESPNEPPASEPSATPGFSMPQFSFEFPELPSPVDASRSLVKASLVFLFDIADQTHNFFADIGESVQDLVTEAKLEQQEIARERAESSDATEVESSPKAIAIDIEDGVDAGTSAEAQAGTAEAQS